MTIPVKPKPALAKTAAYLNTRPMRKAQGIGTASRGKQPDMPSKAKTKPTTAMQWRRHEEVFHRQAGASEHARRRGA
jgi:hypothetical protein